MVKTVKMPVLGNSVEEVRILQWFKKVGDTVQVGENLAEIETDKTSMEWESPESGVIRQILAGADSYIKVEAPVLVLTDTADESLMEDASGAKTEMKGESPLPTAPSALPPSQTRIMTAVTTPSPSLLLSPRAQRVAAELGIDSTLLSGRGTGPRGRIQEKDVIALHTDLVAASNNLETGIERGRKVSPLARAVATDSGVDLSTIVGSGAGGRIVAEDVRPPPPSRVSLGCPPLLKERGQTLGLSPQPTNAPFS